MLAESETLNILTFEYFYNGAGVGAGDLDQDGLPELFFTSNMGEARLYRNLGGLKFEDITQKAGIYTAGRWTTGIAMADINADGWLDLYVSCAGPYAAEARANLCYLNNQDGTFTESAQALGLADTGHTTQAAFFDYDLDGDLDAYLLTNITEKLGPNVIRKKKNDGSSPNTDRLYRNDGGTFTDVSAQAGILKEGYGLGVTITDINSDGWPDVYVSNDYLSNDLLYINQQDGTFLDEAGACFRHTSYSAMGNDVADCNNDARPDIVTVDMLPPDNLRRKLMIGSVNYDRFRSELITGYDPQYMRNTLQLNQGESPQGHPVFSEVGQLAGIHSTDWSWSPLFADIDNDGWKDLLITNGYPRDITNMDFAAYKMNTLMNGRYDPAMRATLLAALQQLDGAYLPNFAFRNTGRGRFEDRSAKWGFTQPSYSHGAAVADLDADGDLDYIVHNTNAAAQIFENTSTGHHYLQLQLRGDSLNPGALGSKAWVFTDSLQQYQELAPVRGFQSSCEPILHFGLGRAAMVDSIRIVWPDGRQQVLKDIRANQRLQVYVPAFAEKHKAGAASAPTLLKALNPRQLGIGFRHKESHYADFKVQPLLPHKHSQQGPKISVGDLNGDGMEDWFAGGAFGQSGQFFFQQADGSFRQQPLHPEGKNYEEQVGSLLFDADQDGDLDLYVCNGSSEFAAGSVYYQDRLYLNDGTGQFTHQPDALPRMPVSSSCVSAGDYDGDGDLDLFVGGRITPANYAEIPPSFLLENRNGYFVDVTEEISPKLRRIGRVTDAHWTDTDGDRMPELLVAGEWMPLTVARYTGSGFETESLPGTTGWWNVLCPEDIDQDGDIDFVAGNRGWNNPYTPSGKKPLRLHTGDFDQNGEMDAVMTFFLEKEEVPVHYRDDMRSWLSPLRKRFPDYESYAKASWTDLFPGQSSEATAVHEFASVWVENQNGQWAVHPLPLEAQYSPLYAILAKDINADGALDLILAGNSYATETGTGRYDALNGLVLTNRHGRFTPLLPQESGLYLPGDHKDLALINMTAAGHQLILSGENNGPIHAFKLQSARSTTALNQ